jgi:hypothetical protein
MIWRKLTEIWRLGPVAQRHINSREASALRLVLWRPLPAIAAVQRLLNAEGTPA